MIITIKLKKENSLNSLEYIDFNLNNQKLNSPL